METIKLTKRSKTTIAKFANLALEHLPMTFSNADMSPGRKVFFPIPLRNTPRDMWDFLYIYVESKLVDHPKNNNIGYTQDDVVNESGFYMFKRVGERIIGSTLPISNLFDNIITDLSLQNRIIYRLAEMHDLVHLDDEFLSNANLEWLSAKDPFEFGLTRVN